MFRDKIYTERLLLRKFTEEDIPHIFRIFSDRRVNEFLPWFPLSSLEEAAVFYRKNYRDTKDFKYAVCLKDSNIPIGYINISNDESHDLGYGLLEEYWHQGIISEAAAVIIKEAASEGLPYLTATHDVNNPRSGNVMKAVGMKYQYSYEELWQPKNFTVIFRLYQINLDGREGRIYEKYRRLHREVSINLT